MKDRDFDEFNLAIDQIEQATTTNPQKEHSKLQFYQNASQEVIKIETRLQSQKQERQQALLQMNYFQPTTCKRVHRLYQMLTYDFRVDVLSLDLAKQAQIRQTIDRIISSKEFFSQDQKFWFKFVRQKFDKQHKKSPTSEQALRVPISRHWQSINQSIAQPQKIENGKNAWISFKNNVLRCFAFLRIGTDNQMAQQNGDS